MQRRSPDVVDLAGCRYWSDARGTIVQRPGAYADVPYMVRTGTGTHYAMTWREALRKLGNKARKVASNE